MRRVGNALVIRLDTDARGIQRISPDVGQAIKALPLELTTPGTELQVMYMNEFYPVKVASTGAVFDPDDSRMKG